MQMPLKVRIVTDTAEIGLPEDILTRLKASVGDAVCLTETPEGYMLTPCDEGAAEQLNAAEKDMRRYADVLRKLAT